MNEVGIEIIIFVLGAGFQPRFRSFQSFQVWMHAALLCCQLPTPSNLVLTKVYLFGLASYDSIVLSLFLYTISALPAGEQGHS